MTTLERIFGGADQLVKYGCFISFVANFIMLFKGFWYFAAAQVLLTIFSVIVLMTIGAITANTKDSIRGSIHGLHEGLSNFSLVFGAFVFPSLMTLTPELPFLIGGIMLVALGFVSTRVPNIKSKKE